MNVTSPRVEIGPLTAADVESVARGIGKGAIAHVADITDEAAATRAVETAAGALGRLDILVNNAAIRDVGPVADTPNAAWRHTIDVNLFGAVNVTPNPSRARTPASSRNGLMQVSGR